jgi:CheY-like chemotaxis protein
VNPATILHVEDDTNDVLLFQHACQKASIDCDLRSVADGAEAIAYLDGRCGFGDRQKHPLPELVLLDLKLPRVDGFEVLEWIRKGGQFRRLPVVVFSSSNHEADVKRAYEAGANSFLLKPTDFNTLVDLAKTVHHYWLALNQRSAG